MDVSISTPPFSCPDGYEIGTYQSSLGATIRYGFMPAREERAMAVFMAGQSDFLELYFPTARSLSDRGISTWFLERHGDGGSQRYSDHPQKPPVLPHEVHIEDVRLFLQTINPPIEKKRLFMGNCLGALIGLRSLQAPYSMPFDHAIFTVPMFGMQNSMLGRDTALWANKPLMPDTQDNYYGNGRDWTPEDADRWRHKAGVTHCMAHGDIRQQWLIAREELRVGGFTEGNIIVNAMALLDAIKPEELAKVRVPVTIISGSEDPLTDVAMHAKVAEALPDSQHHIIAGAGYGLWRETDEYRNQLLGHIGEVIDNVCRNARSRRERRYDRYAISADAPVLDRSTWSHANCWSPQPVAG